ncbi:hypothetical protein SAMN05216203_0612 [Marinobacter daqiaonensis]|uniref:Uncharacterized protein n=1 Tax=Marinobacter daqiaonensis TaxID=650891 RepID=A0A1I6GZ33_9GAMM|nr:hypothetical protein SAMN05216203_0612 [Marinobacter daqiaonensis]
MAFHNPDPGLRKVELENSRLRKPHQPHHMVMARGEAVHSR